MRQVELLSLEQIEEFLEGAQGIEFRAEGRAEKYALFEALLERHRYSRLGRREGVVAALSAQGERAEPGADDALNTASCKRFSDIGGFCKRISMKIPFCNRFPTIY